ncbi:DUF7937 domain-containing protein [Hoyosella subflava]|uniref:Putative membrane protein n=1 Tax=Hoyosella subflava (strain DSM 45089 / JCM 17490 / NBRC 109087 / DQS3-9A1) TaxID=443218 RepID=F6EJ65_HOYSD|nr:hypothetical protein [Hoyosella subflava]AEF41297.1 Putative membrane protein [Hoyosella subflava DQS3-9A1]
MASRYVPASQPSGATAIAAAVLAILGGGVAALGVGAFLDLVADIGWEAALAISGFGLGGLDWWQAAVVVGQVSNVLTAVLLLVGAAALLQKKRSGRTMIIYGCVVVLVNHAVTLLASFQLARSFRAAFSDAPGFDEVFGIAIAYVGWLTLLAVAFPIVTLFLAASQKTVKWCDSRSAGRRAGDLDIAEVSAHWLPPSPDSRVDDRDTGSYRHIEQSRLPLDRPSESADQPSPWPDLETLRARAGTVGSEVARAPRAHVLCDGAAIVLMLTALLLPWNQELARVRLSVAPDLAAVIWLTTLLAITGVAWPYLAQAGVDAASPRRSAHSMFRTMGVAAYLLTATAVLVVDVVRALLVLVDASVWSKGVGPGVWFALAGGTLAIYWRHPQGVPSRNINGPLAPMQTVMTCALVLCGLSALLAVTSVVLNSSAGMTAASSFAADSLYAIVGVAAVSLPGIILAMMAVIGMRWDPAPWCVALACVSGAVLFAGLLRASSGSKGIEYFLSSSYYAMPLWAVAGAMAVAVLVRSPSVIGEGHRGYVWLVACRYMFALVAVWSFGRGTLFVLLELLDVGYLLGPGVLTLPQSTVLAAFGFATGLLAVAGMASLKARYGVGADPRPQRHVAFVCAAGALLMALGRIVAADAVGGAGRLVTMDYAMIGLMVMVAVVILFAPPIRDLYAGMALFPSSRSTALAAAEPDAAEPDAERAAASDPHTSRRELTRIARARPDLRPTVAANPSAYHELIAWLRSLGDPEIDEALTSRPHAEGAGK